jgi:hypothetical protein
MLTILVPLPAKALPTSGSTIFFDDFLTSGLSPSWVSWPAYVGLGNATQSGGYLTLWDTINPATNPFSTSVKYYAGNAPAVIDANTPDGQFFYTAWKVQPFNLTLPRTLTNVVRNTELDLSYTSLTGNGFGFKIVESDLASSGMALGGQKESVSLFFRRPMGPSVTTCFLSDSVINDVIPSCANKNPTIMYTTGSSIIDLNAMHVFIMEMKLYPATFKSWIAFQIDNNAWINVTQTACSCIDNPAGGTYPSMFPAATLAYCMGTTASTDLQTNCSNQTPNQSVASNIDWLLITNYVPTSLPAGQILRSPGIPPTSLPQPGITGSLTDFLQFEANSIAPGNLYAGGMLLTIIMSAVIFAVMFGLSRRWNISVAHYGLFFTMFVLGFAFLGFYASILPIWIPVMMVLIVFGIAFGVIRTGNASGGLVPD